MKMCNKIDIGIILMLSAVVSVIGINYGMPYFFVSDEESIVGGALRMLEQKNLLPVLNPETFKILNYPPLLPYVYILFIAPVFGGFYLLQGMPSEELFAISVFANMDLIWMISRTISVLFSLGTVYVIYRLSILVFRYRLSAIIVTILFATEFYHVFLSHFSRHWSATVFFIWATVLISWLIYIEPSRRKYIMLGVVSGLGFATSYIGCLGLFSTIILHLKKSNIKEIINKNTMVACLIFFLFVIVTSLIYPQAIIRLIRPDGVLPIGSEKSFVGYFETVYFYSRTLFYANPVLLLFFMLGLFSLITTKNTSGIITAIISVVGYILFLYMYMPLEDRYIIPILPVMCLTGGFFIETVLQKTEFNESRRKIIIAIIWLPLIYPIIISFQVGNLLFADDTRIQAINWIKNNVSSKEKIVVDMNTAKLSPTKAALVEQKLFDNNYLGQRDTVLLNGMKNGVNISEYGFNPQYHVLHINQNIHTPEIQKAKAPEKLVEYYFNNGYTYYVVEYRSPLHVTEWQKRLISSLGDPVVTFKPGNTGIMPAYLHSTTIVGYSQANLLKLDRFGPIVSIYKSK